MEKIMPSKCQWMAVNRIKVRAPFNSLFPVDQKTVDAVAEHMRINGYDQSQPIILWKEKLDEDKNQAIIIDGHTRLAAAKKIGLSPVYVARMNFPDQESALKYSIHNQRDRRNLTDADLIRCIEAVDKRKPRGGDRRSQVAKSKASSDAFDSKSGEKISVVVEDSPDSKGKSAQKISVIVGTSLSKVEKARVILDHADVATKQAVWDGQMSIHRAAKKTQGKRKGKPTSKKARSRPSGELKELLYSGKKIVTYFYGKDKQPIYDMVELAERQRFWAIWESEDVLPIIRGEWLIPDKLEKGVELVEPLASGYGEYKENMKKIRSYNVTKKFKVENLSDRSEPTFIMVFTIRPVQAGVRVAEQYLKQQGKQGDVVKEILEEQILEAMGEDATKH